ncbi:MAG: M23 family metallopeptidase [Proteobacteria bacterium]|nr:M23 family metallopeptidase [Pseudomonadota bacterium]MDA1058865.1 M23 family metallopeptidase [Pseudomonadota bacterium]
MNLALLLAVQLLVPLAFAIDLASARPRNLSMWALRTGAAASVMFFLLATGRWDGLSYFWLVAIPLVLAIAAIRGYRRIAPTARPTKLSRRAIAILFLIGVAGFDVHIIAASFAPAGAIDLSFPLSGGPYYVGGGGNSRWINNHQASQPERFALDIVKLSASGRAAGNGDATSLARFEIFGEPVHSPCDGTVVVAVDGHPNIVPPAVNREAGAGNHVIIACRGIKVLLAHLQPGSVGVSVNQMVADGTPVGQVGNSGKSTQPHLHIHAERGGSATSILENEAVPITFAGRFLTRNSIVFR